MKKYTIYILLLIALTACTKNEELKVEYIATGAISEYNLYYLNPQGELEKKSVKPESALDSWDYTYIGEKGDIVYLSGNYKDPNSALQLMIKVNGKIYKQASNEGDTLKFLTVSGVVPLE